MFFDGTLAFFFPTFNVLAGDTMLIAMKCSAYTQRTTRLELLSKKSKTYVELRRIFYHRRDGKKMSTVSQDCVSHRERFEQMYR